jgi:hypothetical protein
MIRMDAPMCDNSLSPCTSAIMSRIIRTAVIHITHHCALFGYHMNHRRISEYYRRAPDASVAGTVLKTGAVNVLTCWDGTPKFSWRPRKDRPSKASPVY